MVKEEGKKRAKAMKDNRVKRGKLKREAETRKEEKGNPGLTYKMGLDYNRGTKKAVHSSEWLPKSYVSIKIVTFALDGG